MVHKPADCLLGKHHKEEQKKKPQKANSATVAAAATTTVIPHFAALMALVIGGQPGRMMVRVSVRVLHVVCMHGWAK
jgi:hypothetical protein